MRPLVALLLASLPLAAAEPPKGALVIVGGGKLPAAVRDEFVARAGGPGKAKIVVIPTASAAADDAKEHDGFLKQWKEAKADATLLHTTDTKTADAAEFVKPLTDATGIWFSGGDQSKLTKAYAGTKVLDAIRKRYADGAVVGGTSAGAAVMSDVMITGGTDEATTADGFGLLPGTVVDQHFTQRKREKRLAGVLVKHPKAVGVGIDESTAVVVSGGTATVFGDGKVFVFPPGGKGESVGLKAGERFDVGTGKAK